MRYAVIKQGVVVNIVVADAPLKDNWIQSDEAQRGDDFDETTGKFSRPDKLRSPGELRMLERQGG